MSERNKGGRPTKFKPEFTAQAAKLCRLGAKDVELADFFGIDVATLNRWKIERPEFCAAIKMSKAEADARVVRSLYERATGYTFDAVKIMQYEGQVIREPYREHVPPDPASMIFWLKNRMPQQWRDKVQAELSGSGLTLQIVAPVREGSAVTISQRAADPPLMVPAPLDRD